MIRPCLFAFLLLMPFFLTAPALAQTSPPSLDYTAFAAIPILHEGRVKPLDSFARATLLLLNGRDSLPDLSASAWLAELLLEPESAYARPVFDIPNPDVAYAIGLTWRDGHHYSFTEISSAMQEHATLMAALGNKDPAGLGLAQRQLLELYFKRLAYLDISRSLSMALPQQTTADMDMQTRLLRIIPPQWESAGELWSSPWASLREGSASPDSARYVKQWQALATAWQAGNAADWARISADLRDRAYTMAGPHTNPSMLALEVQYNRADFFRWSLIAYLAALLFYALSAFTHSNRARIAGLLLLAVGVLPHLAGLVIRMVIMQRPPVTTLYESILFVGLIGVLFALYLEYRRKDGIGLLTGAVLGAVLQFLGMRYSAEGDTMGMLVAVLDTNFWLATHVVTITIGYGCCFVAGMLAHVYLVHRWLKPADTPAHNSLLKTILGVALVALFFALLGTILGGIWADQSWGRFWGWDPKENGAMLIVLWLIWLLHGRITGHLSPLLFALGMAFTNVIVALAWFGVNLLGVGLHSYGFTNNIAMNLGLFCGGEILFILLMAIACSRQKQRETS